MPIDKVPLAVVGTVEVCGVNGRVELSISHSSGSFRLTVSPQEAAQLGAALITAADGQQLGPKPKAAPKKGGGR